MISTLPQTINPQTVNVRLPIRRLHPQLIQWRRQFHQYPELGFQEELTAGKIAGTLAHYGIEHYTGIAKTGVMAICR